MWILSILTGGVGEEGILAAISLGRSTECVVFRLLCDSIARGCLVGEGSGKALPSIGQGGVEDAECSGVADIGVGIRDLVGAIRRRTSAMCIGSDQSCSSGALWLAGTDVWVALERPSASGDGGRHCRSGESRDGARTVAAMKRCPYDCCCADAGSMATCVAAITRTFEHYRYAGRWRGILTNMSFFSRHHGVEGMAGFDAVI